MTNETLQRAKEIELKIDRLKHLQQIINFLRDDRIDNVGFYLDNGAFYVGSEEMDLFIFDPDTIAKNIEMEIELFENEFENL